MGGLASDAVQCLYSDFDNDRWHIEWCHITTSMVDSDGMITIPFAGRVLVKGRPTKTIQSEIVQQLKGEGKSSPGASACHKKQHLKRDHRWRC